MVLLHRLPLVVTSLLLPVAVASPRLDGRGPNLEHRTFNNGLLKGDLVIPRGPKAPMIRRNGLVAREETKSFSLEQTLENESLFNSDDIPAFPGPSVQVSCKRCCSKGNIAATFPSTLDDIINPKFRVELSGVEVVVELDVVVAAEFSFEIPLFKLPPFGPTGIDIPGFKAGLFVDLVLLFEFSASVDLSGGFYMKIPDGSFFEIDISAEGAHSEQFNGIISKPLPVLLNNNNGTQIDAKIDLQLKASFGINGGTDVVPDIPGIGDVVPDFGAGAEVGAFINLLEYKANLAPVAACALELTEELNVNVGAFAQVGVSFEDEFFGIQPTVTTTLFVLPLPTVCVLDLNVPVPLRQTPLPTAAECQVLPPLGPPGGVVTPGLPPPPPPYVTDESTTTITLTRTAVQRVTLCPPGRKDCPFNSPINSPTACATTAPPLPFYKRQAVASPVATSLTARVCNQQQAPCPDGELADMVFPVTVCPPPATPANDCFAGLGGDAPTLPPTSVESTRTPVPVASGPPPPPGGATPPPPPGAALPRPVVAPSAPVVPPLPPLESTSSGVGTVTGPVVGLSSVSPLGGGALSPPTGSPVVVPGNGAEKIMGGGVVGALLVVGGVFFLL